MITCRNFRCSQCGLVEEKFVEKKYGEDAEVEQVLECSQCNVKTLHHLMPSTPRVNYSVFNPASKLPTDFKNRMDQIRKNNPTMGDKYY